MKNWDYDTNQPVRRTAPAPAPAPVNIGQLHAPVPTEPIAPILAPRDTIRMGDIHVPQPNWVTDRTTADINGTSATIEAMVTTFYVSTGIDADRAERITGAQIAGGVAGAGIGAAALGIPAAATGGLIGGAIGANVGTGLGAAIIPGVGAVPGVVVGGATGAGIGAAAAGIPAAVVGGVAGGAIGVAAGTAYGAGDLTDPEVVQVPDIDQGAITAETEKVVESWEQSPPVGPAVVDAVRAAQDIVPQIDEQVREDVAALPGGEQAIETFDAVADAAYDTFEQINVPVDMIAEAVDQGFRL